MFLFNQISGKNINLPSVETLLDVNGVIRNSQSGLIESFLDYQSRPRTPQQFSKYIIKRIVVSSSLDDDDCVAMVIYGHYDLLTFCRRPGDANCWIAIDGPLRQYTQIVFHRQKKLFFALTHLRELEAWDLRNDPIKRFLIQSENLGLGNDWPISLEDEDDLERKSLYCWHTDYLVYDDQTHELLIVTRYTTTAIDQENETLILPVDNLDDQYPYQTLVFDVFKLDFINDDHVKLQYLHDLVIVHSSLAPIPVLLFQQPNFLNYDYKERSISSCYYPIDLDKLQRILPAPIWFIPRVDAECLA
ncbi:hypothetical protein H5410_013326 [Solanum commersonii]|uniref:KIB1-4 beta-propeller domain-containing protein n=1 Tax=Solanum commersonii TaxID=4109 RepID=A0A9J6AUK0_SOLCO|nr:hypothetical protein H5410_013326 [Solanum commersonii]